MIVEAVAEIGNRADEVDLAVHVRRGVVVPLVGEVLIQHVAVAADRHASLRRVDPRGRRRETMDRFDRRGQPEFLGFQSQDLERERFDLSLQRHQGGG